MMKTVEEINRENGMAPLRSAEDILQHARAQSGITQQESVGGSLYCELIDADQAEWFRKDLQARVSADTEVKMYRLGRGIHRDRQEYVYDFVPRTPAEIPPEVEQQLELMADIARGG